jgi:iron-sulfur cluster assembly protein
MINITQVAADKIKKSITARGRGVGIKIGVKTSGCSGMSYVLEFVDSPTADDMQFESYGATVFVDNKSLVYLDGLTVDWLKKGLNEGFEFINPNATGECGCGESFTV